jgi:hypothetical protein
MTDFPIPHIEPIRFVKSLISSDATTASVEIGFDTIPTIGMLVEATAQSSSGIKGDEAGDVRIGFLVTLKNIKLLQDIKSTKQIVNVKLEHKLDNYKSFFFSIVEDDIIIATGSFAISLQ